MYKPAEPAPAPTAALEPELELEPASAFEPAPNSPAPSSGCASSEVASEDFGSARGESPARTPPHSRAAGGSQGLSELSVSERRRSFLLQENRNKDVHSSQALAVGGGVISCRPVYLLWRITQ
jgi:hypothetical protein